MSDEADIESVDAEEVRRELRLAEIGKTEGKDKESRLRGLFVKWGKPLEFPLKASEEQELLDYQIILPMAVSNSAPAMADIDICDTQEELAKRMMLHFLNPDKSSKLRYEITKKTISDWTLGKRLTGNIPPFPSIKGGRTRYSLRAAIEWFNNYLWHEYRADAGQVNGTASSPFVPIGELRDAAERADLEKQIYDLEVAKGKHLATKKSAAILAGAMRQSHDFLKARLESVSSEAFESFWQGIGLTPDQVSASKEFLIKEHHAVIFDIENEAERLASETSRRIKAQAKQDAYE